MKRLKLLFLLIFIYTISINVYPQGNGQRREELEAIKSAFITRRINLTPEESRTFWPVYDQYARELQTLRKKRRQELMGASMDFDNLTDKELERLVDGEIVQRQMELDLLKKYLVQFKQVLPIRKVALLYKAEEDFKRELIKRVREGKN